MKGASLFPGLLTLLRALRHGAPFLWRQRLFRGGGLNVSLKAKGWQYLASCWGSRWRLTRCAADSCPVGLVPCWIYVARLTVLVSSSSRCAFAPTFRGCAAANALCLVAFFHCAIVLAAATVHLHTYSLWGTRSSTSPIVSTTHISSYHVPLLPHHPLQSESDSALAELIKNAEKRS